MTAGFARPEDVPALKRLWQTCFGDDPAYIGLYYDHFPPQSVAVLRREEEILSMTVCFDVTYISADGDEHPGAYLYAVATAPDARGQGCCRRLLRWTETALKSRGCRFTCLRPATSALQTMYAKLGYAPAFTCRQWRVQAETAADVRLRAVDAARYFQLRELFLQAEFLSWPQKTVAHAGSLGRLLELESPRGLACAAVEQTPDGPVVKEFLGEEDCLPALAAELGGKPLLVRAPGAQTPFAMAKTLCPMPRPEGWLGFAFD